MDRSAGDALDRPHPDRASVTPDRGWARALALLLLAYSFWSWRSVVVVVAVAYVVMAVSLPVRRWPAYTLGLLALALVLTGEREPFWWLERGWAVLVAGAFVALTLRWPAARFMSRALGALAMAVLLSVFLVGPMEGWAMLDWQVATQVPFGLARPVEAMWQAMWALAETSPNPPSPEVAAAFVTAMAETVAMQTRLFPALAGLGSLAGLAVSWWVYARVALDRRGALPPLREFRFNDHLVWLFIAGLALALVDVGEGTQRTGSNVVVFMGALYALRGAAVVAFLGGGQSLFGLLMLAMAVLLAAPVVVTGAMVIGIGDTWLDVRGRARALAT
jgi:hypothetical protein